MATGESWLQRMKKKLLKSAMEGEWEEVVNMYQEHPEARTAKTPGSGDTVLNIAVLKRQEGIVEKLVEMSPNEALQVQNKSGDTPLHLAASVGNISMCHCIASKDSKLIGARNNGGETPLFSAVLYRKKDAFLCLHSICGADQGYLYCRRNGGETVLHFAIADSNYDLAFEIIHRYKKLAYYANEQGFSPLHLLATMPFVFRSWHHLHWYQRIIFDSISVDELSVETSYVQPDRLKPSEDPHPENHRTCINLLRNILGFGRKVGQKNDVETGTVQVNSNEQGHQASNQTHGHERVYYDTCFDILKHISKLAMRMIPRLGSELKSKKQTHTWSVQVMNELVKSVSLYEYGDNGQKPQHLSSHNFSITSPEQIGKMEEKSGHFAAMVKRETPLLIAAKNGITEMVDKILEVFPEAINDVNTDKKNAVLLAVENRQSQVYELLLHSNHFKKDSIFWEVDSDGNSAVHLAALPSKQFVSLPLITGTALQIQGQFKWYLYVHESRPMASFVPYNKAGKTADEIFVETQKELAKEGMEWLDRVSNSCSIVSALVATVAFASSATVPGGLIEGTGIPRQEHHPAFVVFAIASLIALCFSTISLVTFLSISTSQHRIDDLYGNLPKKFLLALTTLLVSIISILLSFCSSHFFLLIDKLKLGAYPVYATLFFMVSLLVLLQFPIYYKFLKGTHARMPDS